MNIDCIGDHVEIYSRCIENIDKYKLGTQNFMDSIKSVTINYENQKINVFADLDLIYKHFKNLEYVNLMELKNLDIDYLMEILKNWKIKHISRSHEDCINHVQSNDGCLMLYHQGNQLYVNFKSIQIRVLTSHGKS